MYELFIELIKKYYLSSYFVFNKLEVTIYNTYIELLTKLVKELEYNYQTTKKIDGRIFTGN